MFDMIASRIAGQFSFGRGRTRDREDDMRVRQSAGLALAKGELPCYSCTHVDLLASCSFAFLILSEARVCPFMFYAWFYSEQERFVLRICHRICRTIPRTFLQLILFSTRKWSSFSHNLLKKVKMPSFTFNVLWFP